MAKNLDESQINIKVSIGAQGDVTLADNVYNIGTTGDDTNQTPEKLWQNVLQEGAIEALKVQNSVVAVLVEMIRAWWKWARGRK